MPPGSWHGELDLQLRLGGRTGFFPLSPFIAVLLLANFSLLAGLGAILAHNLFFQ